jgi:hypothetical protein
VWFLVLDCMEEWPKGLVFTIVEYDGSTACFVRWMESGICAIARRSENKPCEGSSYREHEVDVLYYLLDTHDLKH